MLLATLQVLNFFKMSMKDNQTSFKNIMTTFVQLRFNKVFFNLHSSIYLLMNFPNILNLISTTLKF